MLLVGMIGYHLGTIQREKAYVEANPMPHPIRLSEKPQRTNRIIPNPHTSSPRQVKLETIEPDNNIAEPKSIEPSPAVVDKRPEALAMRPSISGFTNYTQKLPGSTVAIEMIAIPGGDANLGSPSDEPGREATDQPKRKVQIPPFWMGKYEITWEQFLPYVYLDNSESILSSNRLEGLVDKDGVSHPTKPYGSVYRERGEKGYPALGMTEHAADNFCRWLSRKTGQNYRLPTEDEWEYACRAGTVSAFFWGTDAARCKDYGWYRENSMDGSGRETTRPVGKLRPNKFGLFDMTGNVGEWCQKTGPMAVIRGGSFMDPSGRLRSASRKFEESDWNEMDPKSPPSVWWLASADFVGFRIVRSLENPTETMKAERNVRTAP